MDEASFDMHPLAEDYGMEEEQDLGANDPPQPQAIMDTLEKQAASFYNECRVYGRLKELGREYLAVKAHGYLRINLTQEFRQQWRDAVRITFANSPWNRRTFRLKNILEHDDMTQPVYAIVKDYVRNHRNSDGSQLSRQVRQRQIKHIPKMLRDLHQLHKCGIVVRDLKDQQYYEGQLADFSHAWTVPHITAPGEGLRPAWAWKSMAAWDLHCFQHHIIEEWKNQAETSIPPLKPTTVIAWHNGENGHDLRSQAHVVEGPSIPLLSYDNLAPPEMKYDPPFDPSEFRWRALEKRKTDLGVIAGRVGKRPAAGQPARRRRKRPKITIKVKPRATARP